MPQSEKKLARSALYNLMGGVVPALLALGTIPFIVRGLGEAGYGLFSLITAIVGYFALLDINITAGSVKYLAEYHARGDSRRVNETITFGFVIYLVIGLAGMAGIYLSAAHLVGSVFNVPEELRPLAISATRIAAAGFLFGQLQAYLQSVPQAMMRYDISSRLEMGFGTAIPLLTVGLLAAGMGLVEVVALRVVASVVNCGLLIGAVRRLVPTFALCWPGADVRRGLLSFSAYSFLSRIAALSYAHADKLLVGALVGMKELAYYTVAATLGNRVLSLTFRLSSVLFPASSAMAARGEQDRLKLIYLKANRYLIFINGSALVMMATFAEPILNYWMNERFAQAGWLVLTLVCIAQFVDSLTNLPSLVNDGLGHPKVSGLFAISRAIIGLAALYPLVSAFGITGAATAHLASALLLTMAFVGFVHGRTVPIGLMALLGKSYAASFGGIALVAVIAEVVARYSGLRLPGLLIPVGVASVALGAWGLLVVMGPEDRRALTHRRKRTNQAGGAE